MPAPASTAASPRHPPCAQRAPTTLLDAAPPRGGTPAVVAQRFAGLAPNCSQRALQRSRPRTPRSKTDPARPCAKSAGGDPATLEVACPTAFGGIVLRYGGPSYRPRPLRWPRAGKQYEAIRQAAPARSSGSPAGGIMSAPSRSTRRRRDPSSPSERASRPSLQHRFEDEPGTLAELVPLPGRGRGGQARGGATRPLAWLARIAAGERRDGDDDVGAGGRPNEKARRELGWAPTPLPHPRRVRGPSQGVSLNAWTLLPPCHKLSETGPAASGWTRLPPQAARGGDLDRSG